MSPGAPRPPVEWSANQRPASRESSQELPPDTDLQRAPLLEAQVEIELTAGELERAVRPTSWNRWLAGSRVRRCWPELHLREAE